MEQASRLGSRAQFYPPHLESQCTEFSRWYQDYGPLRCVSVYTTTWRHIQKTIISVSLQTCEAVMHQHIKICLTLFSEKNEMNN